MFEQPELNIHSTAELRIAQQGEPIDFALSYHNSISRSTLDQLLGWGLTLTEGASFTCPDRSILQPGIDAPYLDPCTLEPELIDGETGTVFTITPLEGIQNYSIINATTKNPRGVGRVIIRSDIPSSLLQTTSQILNTPNIKDPHNFMRSYLQSRGIESDSIVTNGGMLHLLRKQLTMISNPMLNVRSGLTLTGEALTSARSLETTSILMLLCERMASDKPMQMSEGLNILRDVAKAWNLNLTVNDYTQQSRFEDPELFLHMLELIYNVHYHAQDATGIAINIQPMKEDSATAGHIIDFENNGEPIRIPDDNPNWLASPAKRGTNGGNGLSHFYKYVVNRGGVLGVERLTESDEPQTAMVTRFRWALPSYEHSFEPQTTPIDP